MKITDLFEYINPKLQRHPSMKTPNKPWYMDATDAQRNILDQLRKYSGQFDLLPLSSNNSTDRVVSAASTDAEVVPGTYDIPLASIGPFTGYSNQKDRAYIQQLANTIKHNHQIEPIWVMIAPDGDMYILEGQHRARAFEILGLETIPARVAVDLDYTPEDYERFKNKPESIKNKYQPNNDKQIKLF